MRRVSEWIDQLRGLLWVLWVGRSKKRTSRKSYLWREDSLSVYRIAGHTGPLRSPDQCRFGMRGNCVIWTREREILLVPGWGEVEGRRRYMDSAFGRNVG